MKPNARKRWLIAIIGAVFGVTLSSLALLADETWETTEGVGTDLTAETQCLQCHNGMSASWDKLSSHKLALDCTICHTLSAPSGRGHATKTECTACHSETTHPADAACSTCHDPHGTTNAFLIRDTIQIPGGASKTVVLVKPEGASKDGLARAGVSGETPGTGACEICHTTTKYYKADGTGASHSAEYCLKCHTHQDSFGQPAAQ